MVDLATIKNASVGFTFAIEITGIVEARFTECSGLEAHVDVFEYKEGGQNSYVHKLPGRRSFSNITLKRGFTTSRAIWDWIDGISTKTDKAGERKNISIILYSAAAAEIYRWNLIAAYPVKWTGPNFTTEQATIIFESLEIAFDEFNVQAS